MTVTVPDLRSFNWLEKLIAIDTTSRGSNLPLIEAVQAFLSEHGIESRLIFNEAKNKANLLATLTLNSVETSGGIVLSGHSDVVPVDGQDWHTDPFTATVVGENIFGRGTCDMKAFIAAALSFVPEFATTPAKNPVHLAISYDEEIGCVGAVSLVKDLATADLFPTYCVVGEPSMMRVIAAHKSMTLLKATFYGVAAHSSRTPFGLNSVKYAAQFTNWFHDLMESLRNEGPFDEGFDVPFTTGGVNVFDGGIAGNTVPDRTEITFEFRSIGPQDPQEIMSHIRAQLFDVLEPAMRAENPAGRIDLELISEAPGLDTPADADVLTLGASLGGIAVPDKVNYATEAGLFHQAGMQTVVCGPGDIAQAHAANEYVSIAQVKSCENFMERLIEWNRA